MNRIGGLAAFHPIDQSGHRIEPVGTDAPAAVRHAGHHEQAKEIGGIAAVPHGFRSSLDGWASERGKAPREVIDLAVAHVETNKTRAAYARSDVFERRRRLMEQWAKFLMGSREPEVLPIHR